MLLQILLLRKFHDIDQQERNGAFIVNTEGAVYAMVSTNAIIPYYLAYTELGSKGPFEKRTISIIVYVQLDSDIKESDKA